MQVHVLCQFLRSLSAPLQTLGMSSDLEKTCDHLAPFQEMDIAVFAHFLQQANELHKSGQLPTPTASSLALENLERASQRLAAATTDANRDAISEGQTAVKQQLEAIAQSAGLKGPLKVDTKWASAIIKRKEQERAVQERADLMARIRSAAATIRDAQSYQDGDFKQTTGDLARTDVKTLKMVAAQIGHKLSAKTSAGAVLELVEKMTGVSSLHVDQAAIDHHVQHLRTLQEKSVQTLAEAEIKDELKQLKALPIAELGRIAELFGLETPGKAKASILKRIETKLKAPFKAREANLV